MMTGNLGKITGLASKRVLIGQLSDLDKQTLYTMSAIVAGLMIGIVSGALCLRGAVGLRNLQSGEVGSGTETNLLWWGFLPPGILQFVCLVAWRIGHDVKAHAEALKYAAIEAVCAHGVTAEELIVASGSFAMKSSMSNFQHSSSSSFSTKNSFRSFQRASSGSFSTKNTIYDSQIDHDHDFEMSKAGRSTTLGGLGSSTHDETSDPGRPTQSGSSYTEEMKWARVTFAMAERTAV